MNLLICFLFPLLVATQNALASDPTQTSFIPFEISRHMMLSGQFRDCLNSGDALVTGVAWGSDSNEVFKALARENGLPQLNFDKHQGPFKTFGEYSRGIEAHRALYIQLLKNKGFSVLQFLTKIPETSSLTPHQDPNDLISSMTVSLSAVITEIAREKGWSTITAYIDGVALERNSPGCLVP